MAMHSRRRRFHLAPTSDGPPLFARNGTASTCRVCAEPIAFGEPRWLVAYTLGEAHARCGYWTADELTRAPANHDETVQCMGCGDPTVVRHTRPGPPWTKAGIPSSALCWPCVAARLDTEPAPESAS